MRNTIILTGILFVGVILASIYYFARLDREEYAKSKLYAQVPDDAAWLVAFQDNELLDQVLDGYPIFRALLGDESVRQLQHLRHDLLTTGSLAVQSADRDVLLSIHPVTADTLGYLLTLYLGGNMQTQRLYEAISDRPPDYAVAWADSASAQYFALSIAGYATPLFVTASDGIAMASPSQTLITRIASQSYVSLPAEPIDHFVENSEQNSLMKLHVVQNNLGTLTKLLSSRTPGTYLSLLDSIDGYASLHLNYKSDALIFSGFSQFDAPNHYLALYAQQAPVNQEIKHVFPTNTATYLSFGIADFAHFHQGNLALLQRAGKAAQMRDQHRIILDRTGVSIHDDLLPQWDDEFAIVELATRENLAVVKLRDTAAFFEVAAALSTPYPDSIFRFDHSNLLLYSFGEVMQPFSRPYFMVLGNYLFCANHTATLRRVAEDVSAGVTLSSTPGYRAFDELQGNTGNVVFFGHVGNANPIVTRKLKPTFREIYSDTTRYGYTDFYAWSIQLSGNSGTFFTNLYAHYLDKESPGASPAWTFDLNSRLAAPPRVFAYDNTSQFILVQGMNHILHAIDFNGKRLWNAQLTDLIVGTPRQLADSSIVLATARRLYRFNTHGDPLPGFSIELPTPATGAPAVAAQGTAVRLFVPTGDKLVVYDGHGTLVDDRTYGPLSGNILPHTLRAVEQDTAALMVATDAGRLYILDATGRVIREHRLSNGIRSGPELVIGPDGAMALATDTLGVTLAYPISGEPSAWPTALVSDEHTLTAANIAGDPLPEAVYVTDHSITAYAFGDSTYAFRYELNQQIDLESVAAHAVSPQHAGVGFSTPANGLIYLLRGDGTLVDGFPRRGGPYFYYGGASQGKPAFLVTSKNDRKLYFFRW